MTTSGATAVSQKVRDRARLCLCGLPSVPADTAIWLRARSLGGEWRVGAAGDHEVGVLRHVLDQEGDGSRSGVVLNTYLPAQA